MVAAFQAPLNLLLDVMTFTDLLSSIRRHYIDEFVEVVKSYDSAISEPILLDSTGSPAAGGPELLEAVHFLSDPAVDSNHLSCEIDLGSAPVDAFLGLLDALVETGAGSVSINQDST